MQLIICKIKDPLTRKKAFVWLDNLAPALIPGVYECSLTESHFNVLKSFLAALPLGQDDFIIYQPGNVCQRLIFGSGWQEDVANWTII